MSALKHKDEQVSERIVQPLVNVRQTDKEVILEAEMVGLNKEDISIELQDDELIIKGKPKSCEPPKGYTVIHRERCPYEYMRKFILGNMIDKEKIEAQYENGILKVTLQKVASSIPKKIEIKS
ncbi:MAG: Hsp20/alpha crystallin family protein [Candidatus Omnitrophica bacterium]|nr:Hsp20/alpha crystallin family protein [Candidatus Omnitrophota bacterium]